MKIHTLDLQNFRKLRSVRIELANETTLFVGANNSGKTTGMLALKRFLVDRSGFSIRDFTLSNLSSISTIGEAWEVDGAAGEVDLQSWLPLLPSLDVWLEVSEEELHLVTALIPELDWEGGLVGVRLLYAPKDVADLRARYIQARAAGRAPAPPDTPDDVAGAPPFQLWPASLAEFLERRLAGLFELQAFTLDPNNYDLGTGARPQTLPAEALPHEGDPLRELIRVDEIRAARGLADAHEGTSGANESNRKLSSQLRAYYERHLDPSEAPTLADLDALRAIESAQGEFDTRLHHGFRGALGELESLGYPGLSDPRIRIATKLSPTDGLRHDSAVQYELGPSNPNNTAAPLRLPEGYNGLGYQNLVSIVFLLMRFRDDWMGIRRTTLLDATSPARVPPIHIVLVEEPEAHLHPQVQQVFIRKAYAVLRNHPTLRGDSRFTTQLLVSTHSSHVAIEPDFSSIRYFRREQASAESGVPTSRIVNLSRVFGNEEENFRFVKRYLRSTHCDLFFADAAILVEGAAERILLPEFVRSNSPKLAERYITLLELGGSHAHRFRDLLRALGLTTLVIADIDAVADNKAALPVLGKGLQTANNVLKSWHPEEALLDALATVNAERKSPSPTENDDFALFVAFQQPIEAMHRDERGTVWPSTFEDAVALENLEAIAKLEGGALTKRFQAAIAETTSLGELSAQLFAALRQRAPKAEFALDVLCRSDTVDIRTPHYINEGLQWLEGQLSRLPDEDPAKPPAATETT